MRFAKCLGAFLLSLALVLALTGCGTKDAATPPEQSAPALDTVQDSIPTPDEATADAPTLSAPPAEEAEKPVENITENESSLEPAANLCTISVSCAAILEHMDDLDPEKAELVPADGILIPASELCFEEGESAFDLLLRVCRENKLHMEFSEAPLYGSAYIEGIGNLYEFDCGEGSGWMYRVNGEFPRFGCSQYTLRAGDTVEWLYTCDFGADIGGEASG